MSKTMFVSVIVCCVLLFSACENAVPSSLCYGGDLSFSGTLECGELCANTVLSRVNGEWVATFSLPESIDGLTLTRSNSEIHAELDGIGFDFPDKDMPFRAAVFTVADVIDLFGESLPAQKNGDTLCADGNFAEGGYKVTADLSGSLLSVTTGDVSFTVSDKTE